MKTSLTAMVYRQQADSVLNFVMSDISPDQPKPSSEWVSESLLPATTLTGDSYSSPVQKALSAFPAYCLRQSYSPHVD